MQSALGERLPVSRRWSLPSIRPWLPEAALSLWVLVSTPVALHLAFADGRLHALIALACGPAAIAMRKRPMLAGTTLLVGGALLRFAYLGWSETDPLELSRQAAESVLAGNNPYEGLFANGSPYSYGPLGLLTYQAGILGEFLGATGISILLLLSRAWLTLALFNAWPLFLYTSVSGNNDYSVGFLLLLGLVLTRTHPHAGMACLAVAGAIKPYVAAWALPAIGFAGLGPTAVGAVVSVVLWAPVLFAWGLPTFLDATRHVDEGRSTQVGHFPSWSFADVPSLRLLVVPLSVLGLMMQSWRAMVLLGAAGFVAFLGFSPWAHHAYLAVVTPAIGLALEAGAPRRGGGRSPVAVRSQQHSHPVPMDLAPARVLSSPRHEGSLRREEDRIGAVRGQQ